MVYGTAKTSLVGFEVRSAPRLLLGGRSLIVTGSGGTISGQARRAATNSRLGSEDDEKLIDRVARNGDEPALAELYDRYGGLVYSTGLRLLNDRSSAEDLVQDVFTNVWRRAGSFDPRKASFTTWVYRIARNRVTDLDRRRRSRPRSAGDEWLPRLPDYNASPEVADRLDIADALAELSVEHQRVIVLAYFRGLSQREISAATGTPLGTVKSRTTAALRALKKTMRPEGGNR